MTNPYKLREETKKNIKQSLMFQALDEDNYIAKGINNVLKYHLTSKDFNRIFLNCLEKKAIISEEQLKNYQKRLKSHSNDFVYTDSC